MAETFECTGPPFVRRHGAINGQAMAQPYIDACREARKPNTKSMKDLHASYTRPSIGWAYLVEVVQLAAKVEATARIEPAVRILTSCHTVRSLQMSLFAKLPVELLDQLKDLLEGDAYDKSLQEWTLLQTCVKDESHNAMDHYTKGFCDYLPPFEGDVDCDIFKNLYMRKLEGACASFEEARKVSITGTTLQGCADE